jgi:hypothetical protein
MATHRGATDIAIIIPPAGPTCDLDFARAWPSDAELRAAVGGDPDKVRVLEVDGVARVGLVISLAGGEENPRASQIAGRSVQGVAVLVPKKLLLRSTLAG